jgi:hypothetical protein
MVPIPLEAVDLSDCDPGECHDLELKEKKRSFSNLLMFQHSILDLQS